MIDVPRTAGAERTEPTHRAAEKLGHQRSAALKKNASSARDAIADALEPEVMVPVPIDLAQVAISQAISLKRIADALQPVNVMGPVSLALEPGVDSESLAGDALNITESEVRGMSVEENLILIRRLASAVLRNAKPEAKTEPLDPDRNTA